MRCIECGIVVFGPATFCQSCTSPGLEQIDLATEGTLYSYTIVRVPPPGWPGPVPYVLGEVELPEGPHVLAEVIDCAHDALRVGMPMTLALRPVAMPEVPDSERVVYKWRPALVPVSRESIERFCNMGLWIPAFAGMTKYCGNDGTHVSGNHSIY